MAALVPADVLSVEVCIQYSTGLDEILGTNEKLCYNLILSHHALPGNIQKFLSAYDRVKFQF
jgi:hypothetical protein